MTPREKLNQRLTERFNDYIIGDDGDILQERTGRQPAKGGGYHETTYTINLTRRFTPGPRTTSDATALAIEAEMAAEGESGNWARPVNDETEAKARQRIEADGNTPAWELGR